MSAPTMEPKQVPEERSEPKPIDPPASTSERSENAPIASGVSPPMSPSAFSPTSPVKSSPEARSSRSFQIPLPFQARSITRAATTDSIFRSRSKSPRKSPPTTITTKPVVSGSPPPHDALARTGSEPAVSPTSPTNPASPSRPTLKRTRKTSGTTSHCGRHSNDWLFGGISVRETVRGMWKDNNDGNER